MNNSTVVTVAQEPEFILAPWIVKQPTKIVVIPGDATPQYNKAAQIDADRTAVLASGRDADGKFAPKSQVTAHQTPAMKRQAMRKLNVSSQRLDNAIDKMLEMENW